MHHAEALKHLRQFERADLLLRVIDGAAAALKLDAHGDGIISGGRGSIVCNRGLFTIHVGCRSWRHWAYAKRTLGGLCSIARDGYDAGSLRLDRLPVDAEEAALLGHAVGLRQRRPGAADHLARFRFAAPVEGRSGPSEWPAAPAGRPLASDPGECTGSGFLARRVASHDRGDGP